MDFLSVQKNHDPSNLDFKYAHVCFHKNDLNLTVTSVPENLLISPTFHHPSPDWTRSQTGDDTAAHDVLSPSVASSVVGCSPHGSDAPLGHTGPSSRHLSHKVHLLINKSKKISLKFQFANINLLAILQYKGLLFQSYTLFGCGKYKYLGMQQMFTSF